MREDAPVGSTPRIAGVILAAGRSRRMPGTTKLLRTYRGQPVVLAVARTARKAGLDPVLVVVRRDDPGMVAALDDRGVRLVPTDSGAEERLASAAAGLRILEEAPVPDAAMILLGDEPELDPRDIAAARTAWRGGTADLVRLRFRDRPGHPVLVARRLFPLVRRVAAEPRRDLGLWDALHAAGEAGFEAPIDREAPIDVDEPSDLRRVRNRTRE